MPTTITITNLVTLATMTATPCRGLLVCFWAVSFFYFQVDYMYGRETMMTDGHLGQIFRLMYGPRHNLEVLHVQ